MEEKGRRKLLGTYATRTKLCCREGLGLLGRLRRTDLRPGPMQKPVVKPEDE